MLGVQTWLTSEQIRVAVLLEHTSGWFPSYSLFTNSQKCREKNRTLVPGHTVVPEP